ncbi:MAG: ABC transporter permease, partial [Balneolaceae bacterium]|nr:ABC transporter permease [Balneolaceae bacterium]
FGFGIGLASAIVIGLWVYQEWSYDRHFEHADRIYRVGVGFMNIGDMAPGPPQFSEFARDFPEVEKATFLNQVGSLTVKVDNRRFEEQRVFFADTTFFELFSYPFIEGSREAALRQPNSVVISQRIASKYFSGSSAVGKTIRIEGEQPQEYTVSGVVKETDNPSHIKADFWFRLVPTVESKSHWTSAYYYNYVLLREGITEADFKDRLKQFVENVIYPTLNINQPYEEWAATDAAYRFNVMPLTEIYLKSDLRFELTAGGNINNIRIFSVIALFIIILAAVNFINLTTARSTIRAREVGIRKTLGSSRGRLILQFLSESVLTSLLALAIAIGLSEFFLTIFESYTGVELMDRLYQDFSQLLAITGITIFIGLAAGIYPAFYLSAFQPVRVLKGYISSINKSLFRSSLVVIQFTIAVCLLAGTGIVYRQLHYMQTTDRGINTENVVIIRNAGRLGNQQDTFKQQLLEKSGIEHAAYSNRIPTSSRVMVNTLKTPVMNDGLPVQSFFGDADYLETMGFRLMQGRDFNPELASDTAAVILNESAAAALELENPVGATLNDNLRVIGVVSDFNFESMRQQIEPAAILYDEEGSRLAVKFNTPTPSALLQEIRQQWSSFTPDEPIEYYFLDDSYAKLMEKENVLSRAATLFALLAVIISSLGLYGLSAYMCEQRKKEVGIRKILGATASNILLYLNTHFTKPVLISILIALPVSYLVMERWLNNFAYQVDIGPWVFVLSAGIALLIAWVTVSGQSLRVSLMNPIDSLRDE